MSNPVAELATDLGVWRNSDRLAVEVCKLDWPELRELGRALTDLARPAGSESIDAFVNDGWRLWRLAQLTPLAPDDAELGAAALAERVEAWRASRPGHTAASGLTRLSTAVQRLASRPSPIGDWLEGAVCRYREAVLIVVPAVLVSSVRRWLAEQELDVHVTDPSGARSARDYGHAFLLGDPGRAYGSRWLPAAEAAIRYGWLVTAPPAGRVHLATVYPISLKQCWPLPDTARPPIDLQMLDDRQAISGEQLGKPPVERFEPLDGAHAAAGPLCRLVLASGRSAVVAVDRPVPGVLLRGDAATVHPHCSQIRLGDRVAFRLRSDRRSLDRRSHELLTTDGWTTERIGVVRRTAVELKQRLSTTLKSHGDQWLIDRLHEAGLGLRYARYLTEAPLREHYLAPRREAAFRALITATASNTNASANTLGGVPLDVAFDELCTLRRAQQRAGELLWAELADWLRGQSGTALTHPYLGDVLVETVTGFNDEPTDAPVGCLLSPDDQRMARLPSTIPRETHDAA